MLTMPFVQAILHQGVTFDLVSLQELQTVCLFAAPFRILVKNDALLGCANWHHFRHQLMLWCLTLWRKYLQLFGQEFSVPHLFRASMKWLSYEPDGLVELIS